MRSAGILTPPTSIQRYFSLHYALGHARAQVPRGTQRAAVAAVGEDTCVARHHNGVCVVCLSPAHPIVTGRLKVTGVEYRVEMRQVKGKRKRGGTFVEGRTRLCEVRCEGGEVFDVACGVRGTIAEYNEALSTSPMLVVEKPLTNGYLAVLIPKQHEIKDAVDGLLEQDAYDALSGSEQSIVSGEEQL